MTAGGPQPAATSPPGIRPAAVRGRGGRSAGFTLIEVGLVLLIMSVVFALTVPRFLSSSRRELEAQARRLAVTVRHLRHEAILSGRTYRLWYDLDGHRYWVESAGANSDFTAFVRESGVLARGVDLPQPVGFTDVVLPLTFGKLFEGIAYTDFFPDGSVELTVIHLDNGEDVYTLRVEPVTGRVYVTAGYQDCDFAI
jgi:type II secretory pathway pseudopilin PulG